MSIFLKSLAVTVLFTLVWVSGAYANTTTSPVQGMRFLEVSSQDDPKWAQFLEQVRIGITLTVKVGETEAKVPGFDPQTHEVYFAAVHGLICANQGAAWRAACARTDLAALAAHNRWTGEKINEAELRQQARAGLFFPPSEADLAVARVQAQADRERQQVQQHAERTVAAANEAAVLARQAVVDSQTKFNTVLGRARDEAANVAAPAASQAAAALRATKTLSGEVADAKKGAAAVETKLYYVFAVGGLSLLALSVMLWYRTRKGTIQRVAAAQANATALAETAGLQQQISTLGQTVQRHEDVLGELQVTIEPSLETRVRIMDVGQKGVTKVIRGDSCEIFVEFVRAVKDGQDGVMGVMGIWGQRTQDFIPLSEFRARIRKADKPYIDPLKRQQPSKLIGTGHTPAGEDPSFQATQPSRGFSLLQSGH